MANRIRLAIIFLKISWDCVEILARFTEFANPVELR